MPKNSSDKMIRIHVTFGETKRIVVFQKGGEVKKLRPFFLHPFSDVLTGDIAPEHVTLQEYLEDFKDFAELCSDSTLNNDIKIRAITSKSLKQAAQISSVEIQQDMKPQRWPEWWHQCYLVHPWVPTHMVVPGLPVYGRPHPIIINTTYQLWNPVSKKNDGCIERDPHNNTVNCKGNFNGGTNTVMTTIDETRSVTFYVALLFHDDSDGKNYALTGNGEGDDITTTEVKISEPIGKKCIFEPLYYWGYTMFQNLNDKSLYLGCDHTGKATLVKNADLNYPNPQALFIAKRVV
ncbi:uncharacterized protein LOC111320850 isoform X1 [Stylophora pistillata]|uniref:Uncharacterized protein n=2 Tax=Stylophora pistillata TaxID=50429 RepID=A0A2B4SUA9_STYPI|nr:uncharacterized protein LOC111320850 isoform X1 [Stylophora pistillata]XP_022779296.1 uncharacterized protein LOC111320850 isoform X1 [Stylophora pistillata]XP_022779297.1 uncharacterized protein LOC111320850 isoform X1 [Stylophora pistillata]XP_022779298.1 uncharacterized protein LOC111320850 isoform X1 [Stylophora pistillata]PFX32450.1 hypothetical protein AWC38_SpisGene2694 [Stylophora pistillata]